MAGVHKNVNQLIRAVSKETGVSPKDVRKVLAASFASTRAYVGREMAVTRSRMPDRRTFRTMSPIVLEV